MFYRVWRALKTICNSFRCRYFLHFSLCVGASFFFFNEIKELRIWHSYCIIISVVNLVHRSCCWFYSVGLIIIVVVAFVSVA